MYIIHHKRSVVGQLLVQIVQELIFVPHLCISLRANAKDCELNQLPFGNYCQLYYYEPMHRLFFKIKSTLDKNKNGNLSTL